VLGDPSDQLELNSPVIKVYPNPSNGLFIIEHNLNKPVLEIFSIDGKLVFTDRLNDLKNRINTDLPNGLYNIKLTDNDKLIYTKLILE
jgi:hypothetical protein